MRTMRSPSPSFALSLLQLAARNLLRHRVRNALLATSVGAAAALLVLAASVGRGVREQLVRRIVDVEAGAASFEPAT